MAEIDLEQRLSPRNKNHVDRAIKVKIPIFQGKSDPEAYLEWERKAELFYQCHNYSEEKKVRLATYEFTDYANTWWYHLTTNRRRDGEQPVSTWAEMKIIMRTKFVDEYFKDMEIVTAKESAGVAVHSHVQCENQTPNFVVEDGDLNDDHFFRKESPNVDDHVFEEVRPNVDKYDEHAVFEVSYDEPTKFDEDDCGYHGPSIIDTIVTISFVHGGYVCPFENGVDEIFQNRSLFWKLKSMIFDKCCATCIVHFRGDSHSARLLRWIFVAFGFPYDGCEIIFSFRPSRAPPWIVNLSIPMIRGRIIFEEEGNDENKPKPRSQVCVHDQPMIAAHMTKPKLPYFQPKIAATSRFAECAAVIVLAITSSRNIGCIHCLRHWKADLITFPSICGEFSDSKYSESYERFKLVATIHEEEMKSLFKFNSF